MSLGRSLVERYLSIGFLRVGCCRALQARYKIVFSEMVVVCSRYIFSGEAEGALRGVRGERNEHLRVGEVAERLSWRSSYGRSYKFAIGLLRFLCLAWVAVGDYCLQACIDEWLGLRKLVEFAWIYMCLQLQGFKLDLHRQLW